MIKMNDREKNYIAGFFEGEGTITLYKRKRKHGEDNYFWFMPTVAIFNTEKDVLTWIYEVIGKDGCILYRSENTDRNQKPCYMLRLRGQKSIQKFLNEILPFMRMERKIKIAMLLLEWIDIHQKIKAEQQPNTKKGERYDFPQREKEIYKEIQLLNRKGVK